MASKLFKIFRSGVHRAMSGVACEFSQKEVADIAMFYPLLKKKAPLVLGHPADDGPPLGSVTSLHEKDGTLFAEAEPLDVLVGLIRANQCAGVSIALHPKDSPHNPTPGVWSLKHVGFMVGGMKPAVKDLGIPQFSGPVMWGAEFVNLTALQVAFSEASPRMDPHQSERWKLHESALHAVATCPELSYFEAVRILER